MTNQEKERSEVDEYAAKVIEDSESTGQIAALAGIMAALIDISASLRIMNQILEESR